MAEPSSLKIERDVQANAVRLSPLGELDLATVPQLEQEVQAMLARDLRDVVIDLGGLTFMDSSALRMFLMLNQRAGDEGWRLSLVNPSEQVRSVLQITGAEQSLPLSDEGA
jgi:anti-sigma B factor antagonist